MYEMNFTCSLKKKKKITIVWVLQINDIMTSLIAVYNVNYSYELYVTATNHFDSS